VLRCAISADSECTNKCARAFSTVVAESLVEVLLFEHSRLQEMELTPEVVLEILAHGPKCLDEGEAVSNAAKTVGCTASPR
jgi:hypothetical protein